MSQAKIVSIVKRHWLSLAFVAGFITDLILLNRVDDIIDNLILLFYVVLATISIIALYLGVAEKVGPKASRFLARFAPMTMQYASGGLLSGMLIFYGRSGDIFASWPFMLLVAVAIIGNEKANNRAERLVFNLTSYFVGLFSYLVLVLSVWSGRADSLVFFGSGILALILVFILIRILGWIIPRYLSLNMRAIVFAVGCAYVVLNTFYITNLLPPIPLSLKEIVIAESVVYYQERREYEIRAVPISWWRPLEKFNMTYHPPSHGGVACFTRVYAPGRLNTDIVHVWEYRNAEGRWTEHFRLSYPIAGTNVDGYRGYTSIQNYHDGVWRCSVRTEHGAVLGQQVFTIDSSRPSEGTVRYID